MGVPQGGIVSPLLSNLVLHELDLFIEKIQGELKEKNKNIWAHKDNPEYQRLNKRIYQLNKGSLRSKTKKIDPKAPSFWYDKKKLVKMRNKVKSTIHNPQHTRFEYVRYADDWLIGVWGTRKYSLDLKNQIGDFLQSIKLELSMEKTLITNARKERAKFLGTCIEKVFFFSSNRGPVQCIKSKGKARRIPTQGIWMSAPINKLAERLESKGFLKIKNKNWIPSVITNFLILPIKDLIIRYKTILSGFLNYYSFVDNRTQLSKIYWILWGSLAKTILRKKNIGWTALKKRFGKEINLFIKESKGNIKILNLKCPHLYRNPMFFLGTMKFPDPMIVKNWRISATSALEQPCANCNAEENIEMHHVKHIKTINTKLKPFDQLLARINRKQVPLCSKCHDEVHSGKYHGKSLKHYKSGKWKGIAKWTGTILND